MGFMPIGICSRRFGPSHELGPQRVWLNFLPDILDVHIQRVFVQRVLLSP